MAKVSNQDIYNQDDNLSMEDYLLGTNTNTINKKTQTYSLGSIFSLFYNFLGFNAFLFTTDTTTYPIGTPGCFFVFDEEDNLTNDFTESRKITFSATDTYNFNVAEYFGIVVNSGKFLFKLINLEDKNNFVFLNPSNFVLSGPGTTFDVDVLAEAGLSNGSFVNYKRYLLVLEFAAGTFDPADYDLSDFTNTSGNPFITAQDLTDALALLPNPITNHSGLSLDDGTNPHGTTKGDVGLGNVLNIDTSTTSNISEGSNLYFTTSRVLATVLSGLSLATGGAIVSTDSILVAFGKIQKQIDDLTTSIGNKLDKVSTAGVERAYIINPDGSQGTKATSEDVIETQNKLITIPLGDLGVAIEDVTYEMVSDYITNLGIVVEKGENYYFEVIEVPEPEVEYNFDLTTPNWASEGVTDEASFINWLETRSYEVDNDLTNIVVTDFNFEGDRIFCNMTADGTTYNLAGLGLVNADKIGVVNGLTILYLNSNKIVNFNPSIPLPSSLLALGLSENQIEDFNPTIPLPSSLTILELSGNQMTLAGYTASEVWANAQPAFTKPCIVYFKDNIDSISGTNLEAILLTKNCVIIS